jgi:hypothetical protein
MVQFLICVIGVSSVLSSLLDQLYLPKSTVGALTLFGLPLKYSSR